jgi:hypothetical protein
LVKSKQVSPQTCSVSSKTKQVFAQCCLMSLKTSLVYLRIKQGFDEP